MRRGELWWAKLPKPAGLRPVLLVSRDKAIEVRELVTVAMVTTRVRDLPTEVALGPAEGLPKPCVVNVDVLNTIRKSYLTGRIGSLPTEKSLAVDAALRFALGLA